MVLFSILNLLALILMIRMPKRLSRFEILGCWMVSIIVHEDWLAISEVNLGLITASQNPLAVMVLVLNRILLMPVAAVLLVDQYVQANTRRTKALLIAMYVAAIIAVQYLSDWAGLIEHVHWRLWWSVVIWFIEALVLLAVERVFQKCLREVRGT